MRRVHVAYLAAIALAAVVAPAVLADGFIVIHDGMHHRPMPPHPPHYVFAPLEVRYHHVTTKIADQVAVTEVDQVFYNPNDQRLEGTYLFPIPVGAQIDKFTMDINGQPVEAELLDADKARKIYEDIVRKMKDPALLEYAGQGLFKVRIFPIEPRGEKRIQLKYTELLKSDGGVVRYVYPLNTEKFSAVPLKTVSLKIDLECRGGLKSVYSPSHAVEIERHGDDRAIVGYEARDIRPDTDFQLFFTPQAGDIGLSLLTFNDKVDPDGGYFLLLVSPAAQMAAEKIVAKDVVFVLDTSGSMADANKIDQAKRALRFCLKNLNPQDRFEIVRFSTEAQALFDKLAPVNDDNLARAAEFVQGLKPIGGTAIQDALLKSLTPAQTEPNRDRPYFLVFLTDGQPTIGNTNAEQIAADVRRAIGERSIRIFCFGIGVDVNTHLLDLLANQTRAATEYVLPQEDIELKVSSFYSKISQPVLANLELKIGGDIRPAKMHPANLPDLFQGEQLVVCGRYAGAGPAAITLAGTVNGQARSFTYESTFARQATEHGFIPRLWAARRVGFLIDQIRLHGESRELRDEIVQLARQYGIVTPYTAYLIVEDESRRNVSPNDRTLQMLDRDEPARRESKRMYGAANAPSGQDAVGGSGTAGKLQRSDQVTAPAEANAFAQGAQGPAASSPAAASMWNAVQSQQSRIVNGRTFYQNANQWIDARVQGLPDARRVQVKFDSPDYYALLEQHPDAAQWFSVGRNVLLALGDAVYEIVE